MGAESRQHLMSTAMRACLHSCGVVHCQCGGRLVTGVLPITRATSASFTEADPTLLDNLIDLEAPAELRLPNRPNFLLVIDSTSGSASVLLFAQNTMTRAVSQRSSETQHVKKLRLHALRSDEVALQLLSERAPFRRGCGACDREPVRMRASRD